MTTTDTRIIKSHTTEAKPSWVLVMKIAWWILAATNLALYIIAIPSEYQTQLSVAVGTYVTSLPVFNLTPHFYATFLTAMDVLTEFVFILIGSYIFIRKPGDWMVFLVAIASITFTSMFVPTLIHLADKNEAFLIPVAVIRATGVASSLIVFCYLFPDGLFVPRITRWFAVLWAGLSIYWLFNPVAPYNIVYLSTWMDNMAPSVAILFTAYASGLAAQLWRYHRVIQPAQKQQIKWFIYGLVTGLLGFTLYYLGVILYPPFGLPGLPGLSYVLIGVPLLHLSIMMVPIALAIAISRYRLWDVDLIINRSLVYTFLTALVILLYILAVVVFEQFFHWVMDWDESPLAIGLSSLIIAFLFRPLKTFIQERVDRRFYRKKYSMDLAITQLSHKLRDEVDINRLADALLSAIDETMQPEQISLWLREANIPSKEA
ncbi:MAG: hypothetical protein EHM70_21955 [Chloroflexota bacterium]|nr:MAG: hypothetical protein EHM70_21955 [Chloroflexota bacterium]